MAAWLEAWSGDPGRPRSGTSVCRVVAGRGVGRRWPGASGWDPGERFIWRTRSVRLPRRAGVSRLRGRWALALRWLRWLAR